MMKSSPVISVILPFYNAEKTLDRAVKSIVNQTYDNFELILVNNLSSDMSINIA
ncbi:MAG: glycosyltransferase [Bacteroidales bacterium]|nr:glycosyltransferase [Bacteroidales bacterium]